MPYIIRARTKSDTQPDKTVIIYCSNRFRAMRAIKDTMDVLRDAPIKSLDITMDPTLMSDAIHRRLSTSFKAWK